MTTGLAAAVETVWVLTPTMLRSPANHPITHSDSADAGFALKVIHAGPSADSCLEMVVSCERL